jgi:manganese transport protein
VSSVLELALGIMTALGGSVDISQLVFAISAGAKFAYLLLWVVVLGTIGIALFSEMSGRISAVLQEPTFEIVHQRFGWVPALGVLVASNVVNVLTCAAEIGGIAVILQLVVAADYRVMLLAATTVLLIAVYFLRFKWIERVFGLMGLALIVYAVAAVSLEPDWDGAARVLLPARPGAEMPGPSVYFYYVVGLFSSIVMPYQVYFYSSGAIEDDWKPKDLPINKVTSGLGFALGGVLTMALIIVGAALYLPQGLDPQRLSSTIFGASVPLGRVGFVLALVGILFAVAGAAVETGLAAAYNMAQFFRFPWGKRLKPGQVPLFTLCWMGTFVLGAAIAASGVNPIELVEYSVVFAVVVLPFTYYPILRLADDRKMMGQHVNSPAIRLLGWFYFGVICLAAAAAVPLMVVTHMGQG